MKMALGEFNGVGNASSLFEAFINNSAVVLKEFITDAWQKFPDKSAQSSNSGLSEFTESLKQNLFVVLCGTRRHKFNLLWNKSGLEL